MAKCPNQSLELLSRLGSMSKSKLAIIKFLIKTLPDCNRRGEYIVYQDISDCTGVPIGTTNRIMLELFSSGLIYRDEYGEMYLTKLLKLTK